MSTLEIGWSSSLLMLWQMSAHILHNCHSSKSLQRVLGADLRSGHRCFFILKDYFFLALHYSLCSVHWASVSFIFESCHKHCEISCLYWPFQTLYRICRFHPFYLFCHKSLKLYVPIFQLVNHCVSGTKRLTPHILDTPKLINLILHVDIYSVRWWMPHSRIRCTFGISLFKTTQT